MLQGRILPDVPNALGINQAKAESPYVNSSCSAGPDSIGCYTQRTATCKMNVAVFFCKQNC